MEPDPEPECEEVLSRLVRACRNGDQEARNHLIGHTFDRFMKLTRQMLDGFPALRGLEQTGDVFQNAMVRLNEAVKVVPLESPTHFLRLGALQIRRELIDMQRHHFGPNGLAAHQELRRVTPAITSGRDPLEQYALNTDGPATKAEQKELHETVASLPEVLLAVVDLHWYQGLSQRLVAEILEIDERTVKRRWREAKIILGRKLGGSQPGVVACG